MTDGYGPHYSKFGIRGLNMSKWFNNCPLSFLNTSADSTASAFLC